MGFSIETFDWQLIEKDHDQIILYARKYSPRFIFARCQRANSRLGEFQWLKSSLFQHNFVWANSRRGETVSKNGEMNTGRKLSCIQKSGNISFTSYLLFYPSLWRFHPKYTAIISGKPHSFVIILKNNIFKFFQSFIRIFNNISFV